MEKFKNAGSEQNLKNLFNVQFFGGSALMEQDKIDLVASNITFESKYNDKRTTLEDMYAQLIATHKLHNIPFKKYIGVFNENEVAFMESKEVNERINTTYDIDWNKITPSKLKNDEEIKRKIISLLPNQYKRIDIIPTKILEIQDFLTKIENNQPVELKEKITVDDLKKNFK